MYIKYEKETPPHRCVHTGIHARSPGNACKYICVLAIDSVSYPLHINPKSERIGSGESKAILLGVGRGILLLGLGI